MVKKKMDSTTRTVTFSNSHRSCSIKEAARKNLAVFRAATGSIQPLV